MKQPTDIKRLREISARLKELGVPSKSTKALDKWIDGLVTPQGTTKQVMEAK